MKHLITVILICSLGFIMGCYNQAQTMSSSYNGSVQRLFKP